MILVNPSYIERGVKAIKIKEEIKDYWAKVGNAYFHSLMGIILPFLIASFLLLLFSSYTKIMELIDRGDFYIYSVGLLSTSIYLFEDLKGGAKGFVDRFFVNTQLYVWFFSALTYGVMFLINELDLNLAIKVSSIRTTSFIFIGYSSIALLRAIMLQRTFSFKEEANIDVERERNKEIEKLKKELEIR